VSVFFESLGWRVTSPYGYRIHPVYKDRRMHRGIDLVKPHLAPVPAFVPGQVVVAREGETGFGGHGIVVAVRDALNHLHAYCHLHDTAVKPGDVVEAGQPVGRQGSTGISTGSHLHYEVRTRLSPSWGWTTDIDPSLYMVLYLRSLPPPQVQQHVQLIMRGQQVPLLGVLINNTTYVPLRWVSGALGIDPKWYEGGIVTMR